MQIWISGDPECKFSDVLLNCQSLFINLLTQECSPAVCRVRLWRHPTNSALLTMGWERQCASFLSDLAFALFLSVCLEMSLWSKKNSSPIPNVISLCLFYISSLPSLQAKAAKCADRAFVLLRRSGILLCEYHYICSIWIGEILCVISTTFCPGSSMHWQGFLTEPPKILCWIVNQLLSWLASTFSVFKTLARTREGLSCQFKTVSLRQNKLKHLPYCSISIMRFNVLYFPTYNKYIGIYWYFMLILIYFMLKHELFCCFKSNTCL